MKYKNLEKAKAIIADNEGNNQLCLTFALEQEGWEVSQVQEGQETIEKVLEWRPDLLILDYHMLELTKVDISQLLPLHGIKPAVLLISSDSDLEKIASCFAIAYYLYKPFDIAEFLKTINSAYENYLNWRRYSQAVCQ
ncbi:hypothetical protein DSM106972_006480 [Dulcicalothrix desertica PCC 7102]|uniref:Response regulatory domain-containing protein n=1 Tax=Dulcicalothrix desertica PCC 7102 TaxID=232991 RepID=A0A433VVN4_9CYAN|nr:response regulator [Dulcicalothrix desertica]RUT10153.1 hypothetical protein DSM106972_006480 [Dulcicalothrix desertica PCC 7102]TWH40868.1 two-component system response regulator (stage 0 sporulation protein F) [Dulcicalothrix desertica PCC 7102]